MATTNPAPARHGSLVGPLIILLLGVVFLISNLKPELSAWRLFARYWPFLLIFWGVARLLEYGVARAASRPIPRTLTGGEVFLAILLCLFGSAFFSAERSEGRFWHFGHRSIEILGESYDFNFEAGRQLPPNSSVVIQNLQGNVRIVGVDSPEMKITGRKTIKAFDRSSAEETDKKTPLDIAEQGGQIYVRTNQDRLPGDSRITTDLEISVPKTAILRLEGRQGDIEIRDVVGPVDIASGNAGVRLANIAKDVRINVRRSDIVRASGLKGNLAIAGRGRDIELDAITGTVGIDGDFSGTVKLHDLAKPVRYASSVTEMSIEKVPGRVDMDLGSLHAVDVVGPFKLSARSKDIHIEGFSKDLDISSRRGDIEIRDPKMPLPNIRAQSQNGNVELALPGNAVFSLDARTAHGKVQNEFGEAIEVQEFGKSAKRRGATASKTGTGAQIRLSTDRGDIILKKTTHLESL